MLRRKERLTCRRIIQIKDGFAVRAALHSLINARQEPGTPKLLAAVWRIAARKQDDESRKVLIFGAKSVEYPRAERGMAEARITGLHQQLRRRMVELIGAH